MAAGALTEEVALNLEEVAEVTRKLNVAGVGIFLGGVSVGVAIGFFIGHRYNREKIREEAFRESELEVEKIREVYQQKTIAAQPKGELETIVEQAGYAPDPDLSDLPARPLPAPVPIIEDLPPVVETQWPPWNYARELEGRDPNTPYVIHEDEFAENAMEYSQTTYTYYAGDDVLCDSDDKPLPHADVVVGLDNLKFGYGTHDPNIVFIRNDSLDLEMEISRSPGSYEEEVLGLEHSATASRIRKRPIYGNRNQDDEEN